jgi:hypothetical protein
MRTRVLFELENHRAAEHSHRRKEAPKVTGPCQNGGNENIHDT